MATTRSTDRLAELLDRFQLSTRTEAEIGRLMLDRREAIDEATSRMAVDRGPLVDSADAAKLANVVPPTWRAYVSRGQAPAADAGNRWYPVTVRAWLASRPGH